MTSRSDGPPSIETDDGSILTPDVDARALDPEPAPSGEPPSATKLASQLGEGADAPGDEGDEDAPGATGRTYAVDFRRSGRTVECDSGTTVLEAAARAGLTLASSCAEGVCGTCKLTLLVGEVDMHHQGGIRPREVREGAFLPCCSTPLGDLEVDA